MNKFENPQPVFTFEIPFEVARAAAEAKAATEHAAGMAEWQARVDKMIQDRLNRRLERQRQKEARHAAALIRKANARKREEERQAHADEWRRKQAAARSYREPDQHAQCGIRWYSLSPKERDSGCYWTHCHACGQRLIYTSDRNAKPQECKGRA